MEISSLISVCLIDLCRLCGGRKCLVGIACCWCLCTTFILIPMGVRRYPQNQDFTYLPPGKYEDYVREDEEGGAKVSENRWFQKKGTNDDVKINPLSEEKEMAYWDWVRDSSQFYKYKFTYVSFWTPYIDFDTRVKSKRGNTPLLELQFCHGQFYQFFNQKRFLHTYREWIIFVDQKDQAVDGEITNIDQIFSCSTSLGEDDPMMGDMPNIKIFNIRNKNLGILASKAKIDNLYFTREHNKDYNDLFYNSTFLIRIDLDDILPKDFELRLLKKYRSTHQRGCSLYFPGAKSQRFFSWYLDSGPKITRKLEQLKSSLGITFHNDKGARVKFQPMHEHLELERDLLQIKRMTKPCLKKLEIDTEFPSLIVQRPGSILKGNLEKTTLEKIDHNYMVDYSRMKEVWDYLNKEEKKNKKEN